MGLVVLIDDDLLLFRNHHLGFRKYCLLARLLPRKFFCEQDSGFYFVGGSFFCADKN
jgi:hypothetical protein